MIKKNFEVLYIISCVSGIAILFFIIYPIVNTFGWTNKELIKEAMHDPEVINAILFSVKCATCATVVSFILAVPFSFFIARHEFRGKKVLESIVDIPIVIPHTVAGIALLTVLSPIAPIGKFFESKGIEIVGTEIAVIIAMVFVSIPLMINSAKEAFKWVPVRLENVSRSLGASHLITFFTITFRLAWRDLLSGMIITWSRSISEFGAVIILAYHPMIAPTLIYERFATFGIIYAIPVTVILIILSLIIFITLRLVSLGKRVEL